MSWLPDRSIWHYIHVMTLFVIISAHASRSVHNILKLNPGLP